MTPSPATSATFNHESEADKWQWRMYRITAAQGWQSFKSVVVDRPRLHARVMRPTSFADELATDWNQWVLQHGIPAASAHVGEGQSVPVAYWVEDGVATVLHVSCVHPDEDQEPEDATWIDTYVLRRVDGMWVEESGRGGAGPVSTDLGPSALDPRTASLDTLTSIGDGAERVTTVEGRVGRDAAWIELDQRGQTTRRRIDAPTGWIVVAYIGVDPISLTITDNDGITLARHREH